MTKQYDRHYFDNWYRGRKRVNSDAEVRRKVAMAIATCEYFIRRPLRSVLDVACGEGAWAPHVKALRPRATYQGLDPSDYAVERFGHSRNIRKAAFHELSSLQIRNTFDLVVCSDALHYIDENDIQAGLPELVALSDGTLFIEVLTREDDIVGDLDGFIARPTAWYRSLFTNVGLTQVAPYTWLTPARRGETAELER
jgi:SAM-dependent methyltransferase